jgi:integrase
MEIERRTTTAGKTAYRVRWRDPDGRRRTHTLDTKRDAETFAADLRLRKRLGHLAGIDSGKITLNEYMAQTWVPVHAANLAASTRMTYRQLYAKHLAPYLGAHPLRDVTVEVIARWQAERLRDGAGPSSVRKSLLLLSGILQTAVQAQHLTINPARAVRKAKLPRKEEVRPLAPATVEALRAAARDPAPTKVAASNSGKRRRCAYSVAAPGTPYIRHRDATMISILAYSGLRPQEALALRWADVRENTLLVERAAAGGQIKSTKNTYARTVRLLEPLAADLREFKLAGGRPRATALILPNHDGQPWTKDDWDNWRARNFKRMLDTAGIDDSHPYALRHSFASLLLHEGRSVHYVAKQLGHGARLTLDTYGHVIDELEDAPRLPAVEAILNARRSPIGTAGQEPSGRALSQVSDLGLPARLVSRDP